MSDTYVYVTKDEALEAMYEMPIGAIVAHYFTMYTKADDNVWVTAEYINRFSAEEVVDRGLPLERLDLDPEMAAAMECDAEAKAQAAEAKAEAYDIDRF